MRGGNEPVRRGDDFGPDSERPECGDQADGCIGEKGELMHPEVVAQSLLKFSVERAVVVVNCLLDQISSR